MNSLPSSDLRPYLPPIYDQGQLGSCTGNAIAAAYEFSTMAQRPECYMPSVLFIYYNERLLENTVDRDVGAVISDGIKTIAQYGVSPELYWPYDVAKFHIKPPEEAYKAALRHKSVLSTPVDLNLTTVLKTLSDGFPIIVGIQLFLSFDGEHVAKTGYVPMPKEHEFSKGGHAVLIVGFASDSNHFIVRNSWGEEWGDEGHFYLPADYIRYMSDAWIIAVVT